MDYDLLILGAGAAGLRAADLLEKSKQRIGILEARDRIGGRIHTVSSHASNSSHPSYPVDLGAEFIHGRPPQTEKLLKEANILSYDVTDRHHFLSGQRLAENCRFWPQIQQVMSRLPAPDAEDVTFDKFLSHQKSLSSQTRRYARDFIRGFDAADTSKIGVAGLSLAEAEAEKMDGDALLRPLGGYHGLIAFLAQRIKQRGVRIHLNTIVKQIEWSRAGCQVSAVINGREKTFSAKKILITLPVGVLKSGSIRFAPEVKGLSESLAGQEMGPVVKIIFHFKQAFWEERELEDLSFMHAPGKFFPTWWTQLPLRIPILTGWAGGPMAEELGKFSDGQIRDAAMKTLAKCFATSRGWLARRIEKAWIANWPADPFSRGAYSYINAGGLPGAQRFHRLGENILFFAGEHAYPALAGTIAAALASAEGAASQILDSTR
jgi:monoamine oxidase